jgi:hypothetical protein
MLSALGSRYTGAPENFIGSWFPGQSTLLMPVSTLRRHALLRRSELTRSVLHAVADLVSHLRRKVEQGTATPLIHTVRGRGYRLGPPPR